MRGYMPGSQALIRASERIFGCSASESVGKGVKMEN